MSRYLVVANQTLTAPELADELRRRSEADADCSFHFVVPATAPSDFHFHTEGEAVSVATERLDEALDRFSSLGVEVTGEVGDAHPEDAVRDALRDDPSCDAIIVSTLPTRLSRWLHLDLPNRLKRVVDEPVIHVVGEVGERSGGDPSEG